MLLFWVVVVVVVDGRTSYFRLEYDSGEQHSNTAGGILIRGCDKKEKETMYFFYSVCECSSFKDVFFAIINVLYKYK